ncbi:MAG: DNA repair protein RecO [Anaerolineales bacterium]
MNKPPRTIRTEAIVLTHSNYGEADRMLRLYTLHLGKVQALAKGVRKSTSRKAGHLEPFTRTHVLLARGRSFYIVTQAETLDAYLPLRADLAHLGQAAYVIELLDRFTYEDGEQPALYRITQHALERLAQDEPPPLVLRYYELRLLDALGFRPQLFECVLCGRKIQPEDQFFSVLHGGVVCPAAHPPDSGALYPVSMDALRFLRHLQRSSYADARRADPAPQVWREMETLMEHYLTSLLERSLNVPAFLRKIKK